MGYTRRIRFLQAINVGQKKKWNPAAKFQYRVKFDGRNEISIFTIDNETNEQLKKICSKYGLTHEFELDFECRLHNNYLITKFIYEPLIDSQVIIDWKLHNPVKLDETTEFIEQYLASDNV